MYPRRLQNRMKAPFLRHSPLPRQLPRIRAVCATLNERALFKLNNVINIQRTISDTFLWNLLKWIQYYAASVCFIYPIFVLILVFLVSLVCSPRLLFSCIHDREERHVIKYIYKEYRDETIQNSTKNTKEPKIKTLRLNSAFVYVRAPGYKSVHTLYYVRKNPKNHRRKLTFTWNMAFITSAAAKSS